MSHESIGMSDEYYTPEYVAKALNCIFDMDAASPKDRTYCHIIAQEYLTENSLDTPWRGFVWLNPPFEGRNDKAKWLNKMFLHGNGIVLTPDRSSTDWWQDASFKCDRLLNVRGKIKFIRPDGSIAKQPSNGTTLFAYGEDAMKALYNAEINGLGIVLKR